MNKQQEHIEDEFQMVKTGNGYANDLVATTNKRLEQTILELRQLGHKLFILDQSQQDSLEAVKELRETIVGLDKQNSKLNTRLLWLTVITTIVAIVQAVEIISKLSAK